MFLPFLSELDHRAGPDKPRTGFSYVPVAGVELIDAFSVCWLPR